MELAVIFFITVMGLGNEINQNNEQIAELETRTMLQQKWIEDLEYWNDEQDQELSRQEMQDLKMVGAHSAFYAGQQLTNDSTAEAIERILKQIEQ